MNGLQDVPALKLKGGVEIVEARTGKRVARMYYEGTLTIDISFKANVLRVFKKCCATRGRLATLVWAELIQAVQMVIEGKVPLAFTVETDVPLDGTNALKGISVPLGTIRLGEVHRTKLVKGSFETVLYKK
ncbi:MAG: hypothetical protein GVY16_09370 [Planctomycetes bacterium]|jgi:hypothetical protein|nr:hypothetical protein [Planctomycetota bacterium]